MAEATRSGGFVWLTGIEDTFITAPHPQTGRTLDEYELTGHYASWRSDLALAAELGVGAMRYGIPWHRVNPAPGVWDFSWADKPLERMLELGIDPVVDLVHYGVPSWIEQAFLNPDYDQRVAEYAERIAARFSGRIQSFTPLNEPRITAWYAGKLGWWPPFRRGWRGFLSVLVGVCRGIVRTEQALQRAVAERVSVHVDAGDVYQTADPLLAHEAERRQQIGFLALDLVSGRVDEQHPLHAWMLENGVPAADIEWFQEHAVALDVVGINLYPLFSQKILKRVGGRLRVSMPYATANIVEQLIELYHRRYGRPILISETATDGSVARRRAWLDSSLAAVGQARQRGVPVLGYTWWPMFALVAWAYRQGKKPPEAYLKQMGLWDLSPVASGALERVHTPLVEAYRRLAADRSGPGVALSEHRTILESGTGRR
jgi:beta-glucosidase/6-phospho-beta-glucosidase/beta-galactosidase